MGSVASIDRRSSKRSQVANFPNQDVRTSSRDTTSVMEKQSLNLLDSLKGIKQDMSIMCRDMFVSKYSGEIMHRWRNATIVQLVPPSTVKIHFEGWADKYDIILDIESEWQRLAPRSLISELQQLSGEPLDSEQSSAVYSYLNTGIIPSIDTITLVGNHHSKNYYVGQKVDVQDIFKSRQSKEILCKWRNAEIIEVAGHHVRVHYVGWDSQWDDVIDTSTEGHRIREVDSMTSLQTTLVKHQSFDASMIQDVASVDNDYDNIVQQRHRSLPGMGIAMIAELTFRGRMRNLGLHVVEVQSDGNCLFRAVAHQLFLDEERHLELRQLCANHITQHRNRFSVFVSCDFDEYLRRMLIPGTWGDDLEIRALEEIMDRLICIYSSESRELKPLNTNFDEQKLLKNVAPVILSYHGHNHYNSVFSEKQPLPLSLRGTNVVLTARKNT